MSAVKNRKTGLEEFLGGLAIFAICTTLFALNMVHSWIIVMVGIFVGAMPMVRGLQRIGRERANKQLSLERSQEDRALAVEQAILKQASRNNGVVTPTMVALSANVPLESADEALQSMAARGYAEMNIRSNGTIEYLVTDFKR